jgi:addiction module HigA family antidote
MSTTIVPPLPGAVLRHKVLSRLKMRQADLARAMGVSTVRVNHIVNGKAPITPEMALRLERATNTDAAYWLALQMEFSLCRARRRLALELQKLQPVPGSPLLRLKPDRSAIAQSAIDIVRPGEASGRNKQ